MIAKRGFQGPETGVMVDNIGIGFFSVIYGDYMEMGIC